MIKDKTIQIVSCHAEGEVGDVIIGGMDPPPGETLWDQSRWIAKDNKLRNYVLNEPRGGVFRHVNLLVPAKNAAAQMGFIIMEPADTPPMSGSNSLCVATVILETGILSMQEPETELILEAPGGIVKVKAKCSNGKVEKVTIHNVASFSDKLDVNLEVEGLGSLKVDTAYGGDSFCMVEAKPLGFEIVPEEAKDLAETGMIITKAANEQLGFTHPENPDWKHISFCQFTAPLKEENGILVGKNAVAIRPGKIDRSPTGTGCSARMSVLQKKGTLKIGDKFIGESIIGSRFHCEIKSQTKVGDKDAIIPSISGRAWITGKHEYTLDPSDPYPEGYRLTDTWPAL